MKVVGVGTSLAAQWLRFCASHVGGMGLIPGQGAKIACAMWPQIIFFFFFKESIFQVERRRCSGLRTGLKD